MATARSTRRVVTMRRAPPVLPSYLSTDGRRSRAQAQQAASDVGAAVMATTALALACVAVPAVADGPVGDAWAVVLAASCVVLVVVALAVRALVFRRRDRAAATRRALVGLAIAAVAVGAVGLVLVGDLLALRTSAWFGLTGTGAAAVLVGGIVMWRAAPKGLRGALLRGLVTGVSLSVVVGATSPLWAVPADVASAAWAMGLAAGAAALAATGALCLVSLLVARRWRPVFSVLWPSNPDALT